MRSYEELSQFDIIRKVKPLLENGGLFLRDDGKIDLNRKLHYAGPWIHTMQTRNRICDLWHVYFSQFGFIPSFCMECWKVVVRPKSLEQLVQLYDLQQALGLPSKCGIEKRAYVHGNYGGYFYNDSLMDGMKCWRKVRAAVSEKIGPDVAVILKRGCTEFEYKFGRSDQWKTWDDWAQWEKRLNQVFVQDLPWRHQPPHVQDEVFRSWVEFAYDRGDPTYACFADKPLHPAYQTYHPEHAKEEMGE